LPKRGVLTLRGNVRNSVYIPALSSAGGDDAMHVFTHTLDYIALGILIACMLGAGVMALHKAP
jgi:hypothetical protein